MVRCKLEIWTTKCAARARAGASSRCLFLTDCAGFALLLPVFIFCIPAVCVGQAAIPRHQAVATPEAPQPQNQSHAAASSVVLGPCELRDAGAAVAAKGAARAIAAAGFGEPAATKESAAVKSAPCPPYLPVINWYARFLNGPQVKPLTAKEKAWLAIRNVGDPFNILTIVGESGISVAASPHSAYGPGFAGFGRNVGVSFTQDITGEFFGTFLIPSIVHEDPHYHRMPSASIPRRFVHAIVQVAWTQGDKGRKMVNYADLVGFAIDDEIGDLYVPGQRTNLSATATRYGIGVATAPIDNFITEFLPDVARRIHVRIVLVQRIINQVATTSNTQ